MNPQAAMKPAHSKSLPCPICRKPVKLPAGKHAPFCSERCKLIDLGKWLNESYRIEGREPAGEPDDADN